MTVTEQYRNMSEFPFQLSIRCSHPEKRTESITCTALLRSVPGRRNVFDALWNNRNLIVKVFTHKLSAKRHLKREWKGLTALSNKKINAPQPLFFGQTQAGDWVITEEKITCSSTALESFHNYQENTKKLELLDMICRELAFQHKSGVLQKDLHLDNFILAEEKIYTLDPAQMQFYKYQVPKKKSISNLAMLLLYLPDDDIQSKNILCKEYFQSRGWQYGTQQEQYVQKQITLQRNRGINRGMKKCLRTSKRVIRIRNNGITAVFDRSFCSEDDFPAFIHQIDNIMTKGDILKNGNTCFVSHLTWNKNEIVIKRYNYKGFIYSLRHSLISSRARKGWLHAHRLTMLGIPTPKPLAYIELHNGLVVLHSYFITEFVEGTNLHYFLKDQSISENQHNSAQKQLEIILDKMREFHITHGDLKHSNILIAKNGPVLTDLDAMKVHKSRFFYKLRRAKDIERFNNSD
ncbi:MAG: hypothetical protein JW787_12525 [Sedimentisphaerales bacterium]|nr:hypothetical protein [Sedimentisphaerales bacterium]